MRQLAYILFWSLCGAILPNTLLSQRYDFQWVFGDNWVDGDLEQIENIQFDFHERPVSISVVDSIDMIFYFTRTAIADASGDLLFYSNGCRIKNRWAEVMENGDTLNPGPEYDYYCTTENLWNTFPSGPQSMLSLPLPQQDSIWYLFHTDINVDDPDIGANHLYYTIVNTAALGGHGVVEAKNVILDNGPTIGGLTAAKTNDGSGWWIPTPKRASNDFSVFLLDSLGVSLHHFANSR
ncbi:MAG: hypothetical protein AAGA62_14290 [Bacteroidota bacterium]